MKIAFCSSEVFPFAKTGGLADVSGALPLALAKAGCEVKVFMPLYKGIKAKRVSENFSLKKTKGVEFIFIANDAYFNRDGLYGAKKADYPDNLERFSFFSKEILKILKEINFSPDILHCNDWQAALAIVYLKTLYANDSFFKKAKALFTIHNLAYQGVFGAEKFPLLGLEEKYFTMDFLEFYGKINLLKGGIVFSDAVNTVSTTYSRQITTPEYGCGLDGVLLQKKGRLFGIVNAIDYNVWNPQKDSLIYKKYSPKTLKGKKENKRKLQKSLSLEVKDKLFLGLVSRLAEQKGIDILSEAIEDLASKYQIIILGTGDKKYHELLLKKAKKYPKSFSLNLKFDERLAHRIYAGCDCFLMPSRFEPCGLSQMISYKYATVPIVNPTGGLLDTVSDYKDGGGGFLLDDYSPQALSKAVERANTVYENKTKWEKLQKKITKFVFSWDKTAKEYLKLYKQCRLWG